MSLRQYFRILMKRWYLIAALSAVFVLATAYISYFLITPQYESGTILYVVNRSLDINSPVIYEDILISQYLIKDYKVLIKSEAVTGKVIEKLNIKNMTPEELAGKIEVELLNDTRLIRIRVKDSDPERAKLITDTLSTVFIEKAISILKVSNIDIVDYAKLPGSPVSPKPKVNIFMALIASLMLSITLIITIQHVDDRIERVEDIENRLGITVLGIIPRDSLK